MWTGRMFREGQVKGEVKEVQEKKKVKRCPSKLRLKTPDMKKKCVCDEVEVTERQEIIERLMGEFCFRD